MGVERTAKAGLRIGDDGGEPVDGVVTLGVVDLVGPLERLVDALDDGGHRVDRVEALIRVHLTGEVGISRHLPAGEVDRLEAGLDLLHGLVARQCAESVDVVLGLQQTPQTTGTHVGEGVLDAHAATQPLDICLGIGTLDAVPSSDELSVFGLDCFFGLDINIFDGHDRLLHASQRDKVIDCSGSTRNVSR